MPEKNKIIRFIPVCGHISCCRNRGNFNCCVISVFRPFSFFPFPSLCLFLFIFMHFSRSPDSPITSMNRLWARVRESKDGTEIPSFHPRDVYWGISTGNRRPEPEVGHLTAYSKEVKNERSHTSTVLYAFKV